MNTVQDVKIGLSALPDSVCITQLNIPGTHNSAARFVSASWITKCQHASVAQQLNMGVRLLDLRFEYKNNAFVLVHSVIDCRKKRLPLTEKITFADVWRDCTDFLDKHPQETLLLSIKEDDGRNGDVFFARFYEKHIAPCKERWFTENRFPTLGECRGKAVLLRRCGLGDFNGQGDTGLDLSRWPDQGNRESCEPKICDMGNNADTVIIQDRYSHLQKQKWQDCIVPALQKAAPDAHTAYLHATSTAGGLLPYVSSRYINRRLLSYLDENKRIYGWFMADFITPAICEAIYKANQ